MANLEDGWLPFWKEEKLGGHLLLPAMRQVWFATRERARAVYPYILCHHHIEGEFDTADWVYPEPGMHFMSPRRWFGKYSQLPLLSGGHVEVPFHSAFMGILSHGDIDYQRQAYGLLGGYTPYLGNNYFQPYLNWHAVTEDPRPGEAFDIAHFLIRAYRIINELRYIMVDYENIVVPDFKFIDDRKHVWE